MAELDIAQATTPTIIIDYSVDQVSTDGPTGQKETLWYNSNFGKWMETIIRLPS